MNSGMTSIKGKILPGQYYDQETGLHYNYFRYYDPSIGRYITSDSTGLSAGLNTYVYVFSNPIVSYDPYGLWTWGDSFPQEAVDFAAGAGDVLLFGQGQSLRDLLDINGGVNRCSNAYNYGEWAGVAGSFATGVFGGIKAAGTRGAGIEFSHWVPARAGGPRTIFNGNFVARETHALSDPYRYRFMPRSWKAENPLPGKVSQQWTRIPNVYKGAAAGGLYGASGKTLSDCECE